MASTNPPARRASPSNQPRPSGNPPPKPTKPKDRKKKEKKPPTPKWRTAPGKDERESLPPFPSISMDNIHIPSTPEQFVVARTALLSASALGFDTESRPIFRKGQKDHGPQLVQFATTTDAWLLQLHLYPQAVALAREIMADARIVKVGFGLANDLKTLPLKLSVQFQNIVDLDDRFFRLGYGKCLGVRAAIGAVFGLEFCKRKKITMSNWALPVYSPQMIAYAANDVYTAALLWAAIPVWEAQGGKEDDLPPVALTVALSSVPRPVSSIPGPQPSQTTLPPNLRGDTFANGGNMAPSMVRGSTTSTNLHGMRTRSSAAMITGPRERRVLHPGANTPLGALPN